MGRGFFISLIPGKATKSGRRKKDNSFNMLQMRAAGSTICRSQLLSLRGTIFTSIAEFVNRTRQVWW